MRTEAINGISSDLMGFVTGMYWKGHLSLSHQGQLAHQQPKTHHPLRLHQWARSGTLEGPRRAWRRLWCCCPCHTNQKARRRNQGCRDRWRWPRFAQSWQWPKTPLLSGSHSLEAESPSASVQSLPSSGTLQTQCVHRASLVTRLWELQEENYILDGRWHLDNCTTGIGH